MPEFITPEAPPDTLLPAIPGGDPRLRVLTPDGRQPREQPKWRRDFPIDTTEDNYVARRDFTKFMVLISASFVAGQGWIALKTLEGGEQGAGPRAIAKVDDLAIGQAAVFTYPGEHDTCLLVRVTDGEFLAYGNKCTHLSCAVTPDVASGRLLCPCHHGSFDLATGRPLAGPPRRPLNRVVLEVRDGTVYATGVEERTV